jgi:hypothetical protein
MAEIFFNLPADKFYYSFEKELDLTTYRFSIKYNKRADTYSFSLGDDNEEIILEQNIVGGIDLLKQFKHLAVPQGELRVHDYDGLNRDPSIDNFGDRLTLKYIEP